MSPLIERQVMARLLAITDLPTLPEIVSKILSIAEDDRSSAADLTALLEQDHAISARILRLANSVFYGLRCRVDSIRRAVVVLGFDAVCQLALATSVFSTLAQRKQFALDPDDFWMHSFGAAKAAQLISQRCGFGDPESCFTAALLHDIGKYLFAMILGDEYAAVVDEARQSGVLLRDIEKERLGLTHTTLGCWLAEKWRFPEITTTAIAQVYNAAADPASHNPETVVVAFSNELSRLAGFGFAGDYVNSPLSRSLLGAVKLDRKAANGLVEALEKFRNETRELIGAHDSET